MRFLFLTASCLLLTVSMAWTEVVSIVATRDTTIYTDPNPNGPRANSLGDHLFAGRTAGGNPNQLRRALLAFDVASLVPAGAVVTSVELMLSVNKVPGENPNVDDHLYELHTALAPWDEGSSDAPGSEGTGTNPTTGDATWDHSSYDTAFWTTPGGDFAATASADLLIGFNGIYTFSSAGMVSDVQGWLDDPASDQGWFLIGDETQAATARRFDAKDQPGNPDGWPTLSVTYLMPVPEPATAAYLVLALLGSLVARRALS